MAAAPLMPTHEGADAAPNASAHALPPASPSAAPPAAPPRATAAYANHFEVGFNAFEFLLDFGQDYGGTPDSPERMVRVVTAPAYAKVFSGLLARSVGDWEASYGPLVLPPPDPPG